MIDIDFANDKLQKYFNEEKVMVKSFEQQRNPLGESRQGQYAAQFALQNQRSLWFTFFHEAGHILLHGKKELFIEGANGMDDENEAQANAFAEQELLLRKAFNAFVAQAPFSKAAIQRFA